MKTIVIQKSEQDRSIGGVLIEQRTDGYINSTQFLEAFNKQVGENKTMQAFMKNDKTKEFIEILQAKEFIEKPAITGRGGKNKGTWMHPLLFIDFAMWLSPEFKLYAIKFINDNLVLFRNFAGDFYKEMSSELGRYHIRHNSRAGMKAFQDEARMINKIAFNIEDIDRNSLSQNQLQRLNALQKANIMLLKEDKQYHQREASLKRFGELLG